LKIKKVSVYTNLIKVFLVKNNCTNTLPLIYRKSVVPVVGLSPVFSRKFSTSSIEQQNKSNLDNFVDSLPSLSNKIDLYTTINIREGSQVLLKMYNSLNDPVVKLFLQNNCFHLMHLELNTKVINQREFLDYNVDSEDKQGHPSLYKGMSGCYVFMCLKTGDYYIGSAICFNTRYKAHKINSTRPERGGHNSLYLSVSKYGWQNFIWRPLLITNNYINNFTKQHLEHELSLESLFILRSFTQFEARFFEQILLTQFRPKLNSTYTVVFPFNKWEKSTYLTKEQYKPIEIRMENSSTILMKFSSKNRAAISLGIPKTTFDRYLNLQNFTVYSPVLDMDIHLIDPSKPLSEDSPNYSSIDKLVPITGIDLYSLTKGKLFAVLLDKKSFFGIYDNPSQAAKILDGKLDSRYISRYINLERPVAVGQEKVLVYFVMNPDWKSDIAGRIAAKSSGRKLSSKSRSIVLVDILDKNALLFDTISDMSKYLGRKSITDTVYVKKYMNPTKLYKGRYEFHYQNNYTGIITGKGSTSK
jgi:hypothetical protein